MSYFKVRNIPEKRKGFLSLWLSGFNVTNILIISNIIFFIIVILLSVFSNAEKYLVLQPSRLFNQGYLWTLLTSMFMHAGFFHLFVNMLSLFFIGRFLETIIGRKRFFWLYILSGIFAGLFFAMLSYFFGYGYFGKNIFGSPEIPGVGASGAIFAIAGVLALLTPRNKVYLIAGPLIAIIIEAIISNYTSSGLFSFVNFLVSIYILVCIFSMFSFRINKIAIPIKISFWLLPVIAIVPLVVLDLIPGIDLPIGNMAHLGGFLFGAVYGAYLRIKYKRKTQMISDYFARMSD
jgi:membrane associated rhomboid family serine protease